MSFRQTFGGVVLGVLLLGVAAYQTPVQTQTVSPVALAGNVTSTAEGAMEGVVVSAQREGSTILTSVTTNGLGQYSFPRNRMETGTYAITIRAAGYVLQEPRAESVTIGAQAPAQLDLTLSQATSDELAHQLTNVDWWTSMSGTPAQKDLLVRKVVNCGFCHDMERIVRTRYTAEQWLPVISRMGIYAADNSSACGTGSAVYCDAKTPGRFQAEREARPVEGLSYGGADAKDLAQYLASINLSGGKTTWDYRLKTMPRPRGKGTRAIVTVYPIPRQPSVIHDLAVDSNGDVWYGDSGWGYIGKLDPKTGAFSEYEAPNYRTPDAAGRRHIVGVQDVEIDPHDNLWAVVAGIADGKKMAYFNQKTEQWVDFDMPIAPWAFLPLFHKGHTETVWTSARGVQPDGSSPLTAYRLNYKLGKVEASYPIMVDRSGKDFSGPTPLDVYGFTGPVGRFCYQITRDPQDNFWCADFYGSNVIKVDGKTGAVDVYPTPTPHAAPRRGRTDEQGRFWFAEFWGDSLGVFDPATQSIREFPFSTKYMSPYAAAPDRDGQGWVSSNGSDRVMRVNPATGETIEYLMPVYYDARKVVVDPSTPNTIWLPNKNLAQLIRIELRD